jgi:septal ring factor EnvC (AmiA/AmiB activator)
MRRAAIWMAGSLALGAAGALGARAADAPPASAARTLRAAQDRLTRATRRADALDLRADGARTDADRARLRREAIAARVDAAEAALDAGRARAALAAVLLARQRTELAADQGPVARLLAALTALARRPAIVAVAQPGSIADLVHVQAVLAATLPSVQARTADLRAHVARTRALQASAAAATQELARGRARLVSARAALAALGPDAAEADQQALALGERAREIVDGLRTVDDRQAVLADLARVPDPPPGAPAPRARAYRLPVAGTLTTGLGEVSADGVSARGLTFAVAPGARVVAPAAGRVVYARAFRSFGGIVILDHGAGWMTLVTGLGARATREGDTVAAGAPLGLARGGDAPRVTVELRRRGRPVDITRLLG